MLQNLEYNITNGDIKKYDHIIKYNINSVIKGFYNLMLSANVDVDDLRSFGYIAILKIIKKKNINLRFISMRVRYEMITGIMKCHKLTAYHQYKLKKENKNIDHISLDNCDILDYNEDPANKYISNSFRDEIYYFKENFLDDTQQKLFLLHVEGFTYSEISDITGIKETTAYNRIKLIKNKFKYYLESKNLCFHDFINDNKGMEVTTHGYCS